MDQTTEPEYVFNPTKSSSPQNARDFRGDSNTGSEIDVWYLGTLNVGTYSGMLFLPIPTSVEGIINREILVVESPDSLNDYPELVLVALSHFVEKEMAATMKDPTGLTSQKGLLQMGSSFADYISHAIKINSIIIHEIEVKVDELDVEKIKTLSLIPIITPLILRLLAQPNVFILISEAGNHIHDDRVLFAILSTYAENVRDFFAFRLLTQLLNQAVYSTPTIMGQLKSSQSHGGDFLAVLNSIKI